MVGCLNTTHVVFFCVWCLKAWRPEGLKAWREIGRFNEFTQCIVAQLPHPRGPPKWLVERPRLLKNRKDRTQIAVMKQLDSVHHASCSFILYIFIYYDFTQIRHDLWWIISLATFWIFFVFVHLQFENRVPVFTCHNPVAVVVSAEKLWPVRPESDGPCPQNVVQSLKHGLNIYGLCSSLYLYLLIMYAFTCATKCIPIVQPWWVFVKMFAECFAHFWSSSTCLTSGIFSPATRPKAWATEIQRAARVASWRSMKTV